MSDASHHPDGSQIELAGYRTCRNDWCSELFLAEIAQKTSGFCVKCWRDEFGGDLTEIEVRNMGRRIQVGATHNKQRVDGKGNRARQRQVERAKFRALKRLRALFPEIYDIFVAEERARVGLDPWPVETAIRGGDAESTVEFARVYAALAEAEVDVPAPSVDPDVT